MLSVCFRMKVIIALLRLLQWMIAEAKKGSLSREKWQKAENYMGPAMQVTLHHAPTTDRSSNTLWKKKFMHGSSEWGGSLKERVTMQQLEPVA